MRNRLLLPLSLVGVSALALAGCSSTDAGAAADSADGDAVRIVTSTTVYADIVEDIVGDAAEVEPVIDSASVDPHDYEATARDGLTVQDADLVVMNGGGYDTFMEALVEDAGVEHVVNAVEYSPAYPGDEEAGHDHEHEGEDHDHEHEHAEEGHDHEHIEGFNEHVWYDPETIRGLTEALQTELTELVPDAQGDIEAGAEQVLADVDALTEKLGGIRAEHEGDTAFFTEPVGGYLADAAGLEDATVEGFAEAVEHGEDVAPAILNNALKAIEGGDVSVLVANAQTGGSETERVIQAAEDAGVPVIEFTETVPDGTGFFEWMNDNADALEGALAG
ncbi:MAG TPA: zinc ABC transporter substrate-binding protein [Microbacterium sp.]|nr:zinc ABC transporter substrate-binding protein [Microbacterium sp.]